MLSANYNFLTRESETKLQMKLFCEIFNFLTTDQSEQPAALKFVVNSISCIKREGTANEHSQITSTFK
jgi:hypothetical protein